MMRLFIGDPCYVKKSAEVWGKFCSSFDWDAANPKGRYEDGDMRIEAVCTKHGDGVYPCGADRYPVDAGILGYSTINHLDDEEIEILKDLGKIVELDDFPYVSIDEDGVISIGDVTIDTEN